MKIFELIEFLSEFDQDLLVVVPTTSGNYKNGDFRLLDSITETAFYDNDIGQPEDGFMGYPCVVLFPEDDYGG